MPPGAEDAIRAVSAMATQLGNKISVHMLDLISTTNDLPHGFRELSATFLDTCRTLWAIEGGITELVSANRALPEIVTSEIEKKFIAAYTDFQALEKLILKLVQYEHRGTWGKLQRNLHRPGQELNRIHESLKGINEALTISGMAFHWEMGEVRPEESVGIGYASLAAALDRIAKGRSAMAVNKVERLSHRDSQAQSERSDRSSSSRTPSVPPKDSPAHSNSHAHAHAHSRSVHMTVPTVDSHDRFEQEDANVIADDTSSILSLNGFLVSNSTRGSERSASLERHSPVPVLRPQAPSVKTHSATTSVRETYARQHSEFVSKPNTSNTQLNALNLRESLRTAIRSRNHALLEQLLSNGVSPDADDDFHPLAEAITHHDTESTRILLHHRANPNQTPTCSNGSSTSTTLIQAIRDRAPPPLLTLLLEAGSNPNRKDNVGKTPLCEAVQTNQAAAVSALLDHAANPNLPGPEHALWSGIHHPNCLRILLARGADVSKAPGLMEQATSVNNIDAVRVLLEAGISPNTKKDGVYTPLCSAIRDDREDIVSLLLSHNADPNLMASEYPAWKC
ncbi:ankyrin repeat-containing domain protein, partial [Aspergillus multicolor]|uniref:ankyrin repeat domain-containing protein n=1 Tax=Aspergillus multicolor TaxID=41759 RepID=UPI003CCD1BFC